MSPAEIEAVRDLLASITDATDKVRANDTRGARILGAVHAHASIAATDLGVDLRYPDMTGQPLKDITAAATRLRERLAELEA